MLAVAMLATPAVAQAPDQADLAADRVSENVDAGGAGQAAERLAGETINLHVTGADGSERTFSFEVTENSQIEDLERGAREDATMEMYTDNSTFQEIAHAPNPEQRFRATVERGDVETRVTSSPDDAEWDVFSGVEELARSLGL